MLEDQSPPTAPDAIFLWPHHSRRPRLPEIGLLEAVLKDAVDCIQGSRRGLSRQQFLEAYGWIASERRDSAFSFLNACDFLGIDAAAMRRRVGVTEEDTGSASDENRLWLERLSAARRGLNGAGERAA